MWGDRGQAVWLTRPGLKIAYYVRFSNVAKHYVILVYSYNWIYLYKDSFIILNKFTVYKYYSKI